MVLGSQCAAFTAAFLLNLRASEGSANAGQSVTSMSVTKHKIGQNLEVIRHIERNVEKSSCSARRGGGC